MPRKGNPQHNARKRVARERHKAQYEAGFFQRKKREVERLRKAVAANDDYARTVFAMLTKSERT